MSTGSVTDNAKALGALMTTKLQIDAMLERLKALSDDHFEIPPRRDHLGRRRHP